MRPLMGMVFGYILLFLLPLDGPALASENTRPFWTEKSSYVEGDTLYCVGVTTRAPSSEAGRQQAYEHGTSELSNFAQITDLSGLLIETQMTYEEPNRDGTFNVFRLLKVNMAQLTQWKAQLLERATTVVREQQQRVEQETAELERQQERLQASAKRAQEIRQKVLDLSTSVYRVRCGMTLAEIKELLGPPRAADPERTWFGTWQPFDVFGRVYWNYGDRWLSFENGILMAIDTEKRMRGGQGCPFNSG